VSLKRDGYPDIDDSVHLLQQVGADANGLAWLMANAPAQYQQIDNFIGGAASRIVVAYEREQPPAEADCAALNAVCDFATTLYHSPGDAA